MPDRYGRAEADADFRERLERAFREAGGVGSALEELRWRERPERTRPAGGLDGVSSDRGGSSRDPEHERPALVEQAYGPAPDETEARARYARLARFDARRRAQRDALDAALRIVDPIPAQKEEGGLGDGHAAAIESDSAARRYGSARATEPGSPSGPTRPTARAGRSPGRRLLTLAFVGTAVAAFALGAGIVGVTVGHSTGALSDESGGSPGSSATPLQTTVLGRALSRAQVPSDRLPERLAAYVRPSSARLLFDEGQTLGGKHWRVWIGTGESSEQLCVVATRDDETSLRNCFRREHAFSDLYSFALYARNDIGLTVRFDRGAVSITGL